MAERVVTKVRPKRNLQSFPELILQKRVAAYARVSSDSEEQLNSVEAQKDYFEKLIKEKGYFYPYKLLFSEPKVIVFCLISAIAGIGRYGLHCGSSFPESAGTHIHQRCFQ